MSADNVAVIFHKDGSWKIAICDYSSLSCLPDDTHLTVDIALQHTREAWEESFSSEDEAVNFLDNLQDQGFVLEYGILVLDPEGE